MGLQVTLLAKEERYDYSGKMPSENTQNGTDKGDD